MSLEATAAHSVPHPEEPALKRASRRMSAFAKPYSDIGLSEMSQSLPVKVEMNSVFIGV